MHKLVEVLPDLFPRTERVVGAPNTASTCSSVIPFLSRPQFAATRKSSAPPANGADGVVADRGGDTDRAVEEAAGGVTVRGADGVVAEDGIGARGPGSSAGRRPILTIGKSPSPEDRSPSAR